MKTDAQKRLEKVRVKERKRLDKEFEEISDTIAEMDEKILLADGYEDALIGYCEIFSKIIALYDRDKCIDILMTRDGMSHGEAEEFFQFNTTGAFVGEKTPGFATILRKPPPHPARPKKKKKKSGNE